MKILFLSRLFYPHIGGVERHVLEVGKRLVKEGYSITILTERIPNTSEYEIVEKIEVRRIPVGKNNWFRKFRIWWKLWKNMKLIKNADIVHCHDIFFWYLPFRFIYPKKPVYTTFHGYEGNNLPTKKAILMHKVAEKLSSGNICVGDFLKKWHGTKPDYTIYGGVSKIQNSKFKIQNYNSKFKILFLGRLEEETGIMEYLNALKILKEKKYKFEIKILGDGSLAKKAKGFCIKYKINASFKGFIKNVNTYLSNCDFVFVSRYLGILEAMSFKKFVFAVYNNEIKKDYLEMTPFAKFISISSNFKELSDKIEFYLKNEDKKNQMIDSGFEWVKNETWEKMAEIYLKLWRKTKLQG